MAGDWLTAVTSSAGLTVFTPECFVQGVSSFLIRILKDDLRRESEHNNCSDAPCPVTFTELLPLVTCLHLPVFDILEQRQVLIDVSDTFSIWLSPRSIDLCTLHIHWN